MPLAALLAIVSMLVQDGATPLVAGLEPTLNRRAADFAVLLGELARSAGDVDIDALRAEAGRALEAGQFAQADRALGKAELKAFGGSSDLAQMSRPMRLAAARCRGDRGATSLLRLQPDAYREASQRYGEAAAIVGSADIDRQREFVLRQLASLRRLGEDFGDAAAFEAGIALARTQLAGLDNFDDTVAWASVQDELGLSLAGLAALQGDKTRLAEAASCYRTALEDVRREVAPALWTRLQIHLGEATLTLGRSIGGEILTEMAVEDLTAADLALIEESVDAFKAVCAASQRPDNAEIWARLHSDLGDGLCLLGTRMSGTARLEDAINAYQVAMAGLPRDRRPQDWARVNHQTGVALFAMAQRYGEPLFLEEAVASFKAALEERPRDHDPIAFAASSAGLGQAMIDLAGRRRDTGLAEGALAPIMAAMKSLQAAGETVQVKKVQAQLVKAGAVVEALRAG